MENFWLSCLSQFEKELPSQQFNTWIKPLRVETGEGGIQLIAPNRFVSQWIKDKFLGRIKEIANEHFDRPITIELIIAASSNEDVQLNNAQTNAVAIKPVKIVKPDNSRLNPSFTFDSFVTGKANQLARAAALQVAEHVGVAYNPLFVYGGVGLGKTHLIQAIGNFVKENNPDAKISYIHAERYVSDVVRAYQHKAFDEFTNAQISVFEKCALQIEQAVG